MAVTVQLRGKKFQINPDDVEKARQSLSQGCGRKYAVVIKGEKYAPKEVIKKLLEKKAISLTKMDFTTMDAVRILRRLGYNIVEKEEEEKKQISLLDLAGKASWKGDCLEEEDAWHE